MPKYQYLILLTILSFISCEVTAYIGETSELGTKSTKSKMLYNSRSSTSSLFLDGPYADKIDDSKSTYKEQAQMSGMFIPSLEFNLENNNELSLKGYSGFYGLGIGEKRSNKLFDTMNENLSLKDKMITIQFTPIATYIFFKSEIAGVDPKQKFCQLVDRKKLPKEYKETWICDHSYMFLSKEESKDNLWLNETIEIGGLVAFDTFSRFITIPLELADMVFNKYNLQEYAELIKTETDAELKFHRNFTQYVINNLPNLYLIFEGVAYGVPPTALFEFIEGRPVTYLRFKKDSNKLWTVGYPFFETFQVSFDFDDARVGISGDRILDFRDEWKENKEDTEGFFGKQNLNNVLYGAGAIIGFIILIVVLCLSVRACRKSNQTHSELIEEPEKF